MRIQPVKIFSNYIFWLIQLQKSIEKSGFKLDAAKLDLIFMDIIWFSYNTGLTLSTSTPAHH